MIDTFTVCTEVHCSLIVQAFFVLFINRIYELLCINHSSYLNRVRIQNRDRVGYE